MKRLVATTITALIVLTGCSQAPAEPATTVTVTASPSPTLNPDAENLALLHQVWDQTSAANRRSMCLLPSVASESLYKAATKGGNPSGLTPSLVDSFFAEVC